METISITLSNEKLRQLQELASKLGVTLEDLVRLSVEELLTKPNEQFQEAVNYVLEKNSELYRRLAE
jgi:predicted DNA-binding protein